jgi:fatty acid-binding protein DegV
LEEAELLAKRVCEIAQPKEIIIVPHEPFTGAHVGPGMLALFFFGEERK